MDLSSDDLKVEAITTLRAGGETAVVEARKLIADVRSATTHAGVKTLRDAIDAVAAEGSAGLKDKSAGQLLGRLAIIVDRLAVGNASEEMCWQAITAANALKFEGGSAFAESVISKLEYRLSSSAPIYIVVRGLLFSVAVAVALGVVVFALYGLGVAVAGDGMPYLSALVMSWQELQVNIYAVAAFFGLMGAMVSILLSLAQFDLVKRSEQFLFVSGAVLPIVGVILAIVTTAIFVSGIVTTDLVDTNNERAVSFFIVLGFIAGFSERFARGLLLTFESRYATGTDTVETTTTTTSAKGTTGQKVNPPR